MTLFSSNTTKVSVVMLRTALFGAAGILAPALHADVEAGLLGQRYVEASIFNEDIRTANIDSGLGAVVRANMPVNPWADLTVGGLIEKIDTNDYRERQVFATFTAYREMSGYTPFLDVSLGNVWQSSTFQGTRFRDDEAIYALGVGVEAPIGDATAIVGRVSFNRYFDGDLSDYWLYTAAVNHWLSPRVALIGSITFRGSDSVYFSAGVGLRL